MRALIFIFGCMVLGHGTYAQQMPDTTYRFVIIERAYEDAKGPLILIDEFHNNLHTKDGGFRPLSILLEQDGYRTGKVDVPITDPNILSDCEILIIANALNDQNRGNWVLPTPSAFSKEEISAISSWVDQGGKLLLIADHMPFAGAASDLAGAFGFGFLNGFAMTGDDLWPPSVFSIGNGGLHGSFITKGHKDHEQIRSLATFTGSAFKIPDEAIPVIQFSADHWSLQPDTAWRFNENTPSKGLEGHYQGAVMKFGKGKVAIFGEAAMFTAQRTSDGLKAGFNSPYAPDNARFVLNLIHWLDGVEEYSGAVHEGPDRSADEEAILQANRAMEDAFLSNDLVEVASFYTDQAVMVGNRHQVIGREAIDEYWSGLKDRGISWELENVHLEVHGPIAIQRGISRMEFYREGEAYLSEIRFTLIWKKVLGQWKIDLDHYSLL